MSDTVVVDEATLDSLQAAVTAFAERVSAAVRSAQAEAAAVQRSIAAERDRRAQDLLQAERALSASVESDGPSSRAPWSTAGASAGAAERAVVDARRALDLVLVRERSVAVAVLELRSSIGHGADRVGGQSAKAARTLDDLKTRVRAATSVKLDADDRAALRDITGAGHRQLNEALSRGSIQEIEAVAHRVAAVSHAVKKLDVHPGTVIRGSSGLLSDEQLDRYTPGDIVTESRFLHTSVDPDVADGAFRGNVVWVVKSATGRSVSGHSEVGTEREVVFDTFTRFQVLARQRIEETGQWLIYMEQM